jgi:adenylate kinase family enzyme
MYGAFVKLFVLGMPGSGKSTIAQGIEQHVQGIPHWSACHVNDYDILSRLYREQRNRFLPAQYEGFTIKDPTLYDEVLRRLEEQVKGMEQQSLPEKNQLVLIEFARCNYQPAFKAFSADFLKDASFLFLDVKIDICKERVFERVHKLKDEKNRFDCFVPRGIFTRYQLSENSQYFRCDFRNEYQIPERRLKIITNDDALLEALPEIDEFVNGALRGEPVLVR